MYTGKHMLMHGTDEGELWVYVCTSEGWIGGESEVRQLIQDLTEILKDHETTRG